MRIMSVNYSSNYKNNQPKFGIVKQVEALNDMPTELLVDVGKRLTTILFIKFETPSLAKVTKKGHKIHDDLPTDVITEIGRKKFITTVLPVINCHDYETLEISI